MENFVEGWTERIRYQLKAGGNPFPIPAGATLAIVMKDKAGTPFIPGGTTAIETASTGNVYFDPISTDLVESKSPIQVRWKVTAAGKDAYWPRLANAPEQWVVGKP